MIKFIESINFAIEGFFHAMRSQRNMRIHFLAAALILLTGIYLNISGIELMLIMLAVAFVLVAEMINTAIEFSIDMITKERNPIAGMVKDICAGAVLVSAVSAIIISYIIFSKYLNMPLEGTIQKIKQSPWHITFIVFIAVLSLVIFLKITLRKGKPLSGGMPSGHAALSFSIWTIICFYANSSLIIILTFILAFLLAKSRVTSAIHSWFEVLAGSILGILATTILLQMLK